MARKGTGLSYEELFSRFQTSMARSIPVHQEVRGWVYVYRQAQDQRKRLANRSRQLDKSAGKVFWAAVLPETAVDKMDAAISASVEELQATEEKAAKEIKALLRKDSWYREVALPAAKGIGMSEDNGMLTAAKLLDAFGSMTRFQTIGQLMRFARLAPEDGKAPKRTSGQHIKYSPKAFQALFDLTDQWNRHPECHWRQRWDYWKAYYRELHPADLMEEAIEDGKRKERQAYPDGRILNMARRKVMREFLHDLWDLWRAWEANNQPPETVAEVQ